tara:strand:+ start:686 stop:823 length:138 start_codon:yes stop_codon:yes gene_type:complete
MSYDAWLEPDDVWDCDEDLLEFDRDDYEAMKADEEYTRRRDDNEE